MKKMGKRKESFNVSIKELLNIAVLEECIEKRKTKHEVIVKALLNDPDFVKEYEKIEKECRSA